MKYTLENPEVVPGIRGYEKVVDRFVESSRALNFSEVCKDFLEYVPSKQCNVLDVGSGIGQNSAALAELGHKVTAVEPMHAFLQAAQTNYPHHGITWLCDSLPLLNSLGNSKCQFDFILIDGVWHHLEENERLQSMLRLSALLKPGGCCAISLRNGPPGGGTHVFSTCSNRTLLLAEHCGLKTELHLINQASIMKNKSDVTWSRVVFRK